MSQPRRMMSRVMDYNAEETGQPVLRQYYCLCNSHCQEIDDSPIFQRLLRTLEAEKTGQPPQPYTVIESFDEVVLVRDCGDSEYGQDFNPHESTLPPKEAEEKMHEEVD